MVDLYHGYCMYFMALIVIIFNRGKINRNSFLHLKHINFLSFLFFNFSWYSKENSKTRALKYILCPRNLRLSWTISLPHFSCSCAIHCTKNEVFR